MKRRHFLRAGIALAAASSHGVPSARAARTSYVRPGMPGWPTDADWASLNQAVGGRLLPVSLPNFEDPTVHTLLRDPFYIGDQPGLTQSSGWLDAWRSSPCA